MNTICADNVVNTSELLGVTPVGARIPTNTIGELTNTAPASTLSSTVFPPTSNPDPFIQPTSNPPQNVSPFNPNSPIKIFDPNLQPNVPRPTMPGFPTMAGPMPPMAGQIPPMTGPIPPMTGAMPTLPGALLPMQGPIPPMMGPIPSIQGAMPPMMGHIPPMQGAIPPMMGPIPPMQGATPPLQGISMPGNFQQLPTFTMPQVPHSFSQPTAHQQMPPQASHVK